MSAKTIWKLDDHNNYPTNCFPAHGLARRLNEGRVLFYLHNPITRTCLI